MKINFVMEQASLTANDIVELEDGATVIEGFKAFVAPYLEKGYSYQKEQVFVVNSKMAEETDVLRDGDKVYVFALLSGG